jgi:serine-type D-Ala-D-Ala endopeptidase (penicillin-binding protein 7)
MKYLLALLIFVTNSVFAKGSYLLYDYELGVSQVAYNVDQVRPIASITKLFTAIVILRSGVEMEEKVKVQGKSRGKFPRGSQVTRMNLMRAMLISSDNLAAQTLANTYPGGFNQFIIDTNIYVNGMGLINTKIVDSSGLLAGNISTAKDLARFLWIIKNNPTIREISNEPNEVISIPKGKRTLKIHLRNTNPSIFVFDNILISKTGFTSPAGRCVVMLVEKNGTYNAVIVLGQKNVKARSRIANDLITVDPLEKPKETVHEPIEFNFGM